ncbi:MAG: hypothetical protein ACP5NC_06080, partial [Nitrososphaeria archaeon]
EYIAFLSYNPSTETIANLSSGLPIGYPLGVFSFKNQIGILLSTNKGLGEFLAYNPVNGKLNNYTNLISQAELYYVSVATSENGITYLLGSNLAYINQSTMQVNYLHKLIGNFVTNFWTSSTQYGAGGFLTTGGDGMIFYSNGSFESPTALPYVPGFLTGSAWDGQQFLLVGTRYEPRGGVLMYLYNPYSNLLVNETGLFPASLSVNASLKQVAWNGTEFVMTGAKTFINSTGYWVRPPENLLYAFNPATGKLYNITSLLPFNIGSASNIISTPYGFFIIGEGTNGTQFGMLANNGKFINLNSKLPSYFVTGYNNYGYQSNDMYWNGQQLIVVGSSNNGSIAVFTYNPLTNTSTSYDSLFSGIKGVIGEVTYANGMYLLGGYSWNSSANVPLLLAFEPGQQPVNISSSVPSGLTVISTMASNGSIVFLTGGSFGNIKYGLLNVINVAFPVSTVTRVVNGSATVKVSTYAGNVTATVTGASAINNKRVSITVSVINRNATAITNITGTAPISIVSGIELDVKVSTAVGFTNLTFTNPSINSLTKMLYWNGSGWTMAQSIRVVNHTISGLIPNEYLNGTPVFIGVPFSFSLSVSPNSATVTQGSSTTATVTSTLISGSSTVSLSASGQPSGISISFTPTSGSPTFSSTMTVSVGANVPAGTYPITVTATGGGVTHTATFDLTVTSPTVTPPPTATYTVTFQESGLPSGTQWSATLDGATESATGSSITFTGIPAGTYSWNITPSVMVGTVNYVAVQGSGTVSVSGATTVSVKYMPQITVPANETITFPTTPIQMVISGYNVINVTMHNNVTATLTGIPVIVLSSPTYSWVAIGNPASIAPGHTVSDLVSIQNIPAGTYTAKVFIVMPNGVTVSEYKTFTISVL